MLKAIIPVEQSGLINAVNEYELLYGELRPYFVDSGTNAEIFTNDLICFLTACELYEDSEYEVLAKEWYDSFSVYFKNEAIEKYYDFLLDDAMSLSLSPHFNKRVVMLKRMERK